MADTRDTSIEVVVLAYDQANAVDIFGPLQVFASVNEALQRERYRTHLISLTEHTEIRLATQTRIMCDGVLADLAASMLDTLLIVGGTPAPHLAQDPHMTATLQALLPAIRRVASVCSGAFITCNNSYGYVFQPKVA